MYFIESTAFFYLVEELPVVREQVEEKSFPQTTEAAIQIATSNDLLVGAQWPHLAINEQRLILYMLSMIKRSDKDFQTYRISVRELGNVLGLKRKDLYGEFDRAAEGLMQKTINFIDPEYTKSKKEVRVAWCSSASRIRGEGLVEMRFDPALKPFLLALKGNFTIWGDRRSIIRLKSHYSLRIYQFIKYNQGLANVDGRKSATVELSWLRDFLAIPEEKYRLFGHFKSRVLVPAQKDIRQKTDIDFDFKQIKKGRKVHEIQFFWKVNKRHSQMELPGLSDSTPVKIEDILIYEFGISPEKKARELAEQFGYKHITQALEVAREYIDNLRQRGDKVANVGGIARKAIEEGWKPQESTIEREHLEQQQAIAQAKKVKEQEEEEQRTRTEQAGKVAMASYEEMGEAEQEELLADFRGHLVGMGNRTVIDRYDDEGVSPGMLEALFKAFVLEQLGDNMQITKPT